MTAWQSGFDHYYLFMFLVGVQVPTDFAETEAVSVAAATEETKRRTNEKGMRGGAGRGATTSAALGAGILGCKGSGSSAARWRAAQSRLWVTRARRQVQPHPRLR